MSATRNVSPGWHRRATATEPGEMSAPDAVTPRSARYLVRWPAAPQPTSHTSPRPASAAAKRSSRSRSNGLPASSPANVAA